MYEQENIKPYNKNKEKGPQVALMFDNIAHSYDFLNHFLSLGIDKIWRRKAIMGLRKLHPAKILDVATGTADFAILSSRLLHPQQVTGIDISEGMLEVGRQKVEKLGIDNIVLEKGDCMYLAFDDGTFDAVTVAYGVRNFASLDQGLREISAGNETRAGGCAGSRSSAWSCSVRTRRGGEALHRRGPAAALCP